MLAIIHFLFYFPVLRDVLWVEHRNAQTGMHFFLIVFSLIDFSACQGEMKGRKFRQAY